MKKEIIKLVLSIVLLLLMNSNGYTQDTNYGKNGFNLNLGFGIVGPTISLGVFEESLNTYGEIYYEHDLFDLERNENLVNKPTSGGYQVGFNFIPKYVSGSRFKFLIGIGGGRLYERSGENTGEHYTGYTDYYYVNGGIRFFIIKKLFIQGWAGYPINQDLSNTILKKYYSNITDADKQSIIPVSFSVQFLF